MKLSIALFVTAALAAQAPFTPAVKTVPDGSIKIGYQKQDGAIKIRVADARTLTAAKYSGTESSEWVVYWSPVAKVQMPTATEIDVVYLDAEGKMQQQHHRSVVMPGDTGEMRSRPFAIPISSVISIRTKMEWMSIFQ